MLPLIAIAVGVGALVFGAGLTAYISKLRTISINEGYKKASEEFEKKYKQQYEEFMNRTKTWEKDKQEYEELIKAYQEFIEELMKESEDIKRNGAASASGAAIALLRLTPVEYNNGLEKEIQHYMQCLKNLQTLRG